MKKMFALLMTFAVAAAFAAEITLPSAKGSEAYKRVLLPAVKFNKGDKVLLNFDMYMQRKTPRGWAPVVALQLNGKTIREKDSKGVARMRGVNAKGFKVSDKGKEILRSWWYQGSRIYVFYTPGVGKCDSRALLGENAGKYSLDVTDLMTSGKRIDFRAVNYLYREIAGFDAVLKVQNIKFQVVPAKK